jgi:hypothetical protein
MSEENRTEHVFHERCPEHPLLLQSRTTSRDIPLPECIAQYVFRFLVIDGGSTLECTPDLSPDSYLFVLN